ncbi:DUF924 family protein [Amphritea japonica]|uniref:Transmembrane protein n=1 Tax=Amphritea japonica ATCC BAA-1530 TaxID=1278309 RepID=A0A7R6ST91_9GAMM|nr:DUF924 family protein [Amphritea japonica]BBB27070.1 conserved hypothetical protein [Amphritea japonica ATCC BAA-1530]
MYQEIINFWFSEIDNAQWFIKDVKFDQLIIERFSEIHTQAVACELFPWRKTASGSLAEIIVLDQFSRNMFRDTPQSFAHDTLALALAQSAIEKGFDTELSEEKRPFFYLPFMHSESLMIHTEAERLYAQLGNPSSAEFEHKHKVIIERFGRYPHRNEVLGRISTPEEKIFLTSPDSGF